MTTGSDAAPLVLTVVGVAKSMDINMYMTSLPGDRGRGEASGGILNS